MQGPGATLDLIPSAPGRGLVMPIGGAEDTSGVSDILREFVRLAGGEQAHIVVIPTASETPEESGRIYGERFRQLGARDADVLLADTPRAAERDDALAMFARASGIFMTGGDQGRLAHVFCDTRAAETILRRNREGVIVAGTSARAAFMSAWMIDGGISRATPVKGMTGMGLLRNIVVDTHFGERGRTGRLLEILAASPELITLGLDEDTAAIVDHDLLMRVVGSGAVTVLDGTAIRSDYALVADEEAVMINGGELHAITARYTFDLRARKFVPPLRVGWTQDDAPER